jgi:phage terminase large subunit GpA-like protein
MREFAEQEIVIPDGPYRGRRFQCDRQPFNRLWFEAVDCGRWKRHVATGPSQSSKTLVCYIIPTLYHLFEHKETVIAGVPDMNMAADKYRKDLLPAIAASRFADQLPTRGGGSRGGDVETIDFKNGATLKWMSGGGSDKRRAGYTARVVVITETDAMDAPGEASREADKITQIEARTRAYGDRARVYMECTLSIEEGRTNRELEAGTNSRLALPCPHCRAVVSPEREHVRGWEDAATLIEARRLARWHCPECGKVWTESDRRKANEGAVLVHRGQTVRRLRSGRLVIEGQEPETDTLGFRWSAVNNAFLSAGDIGADLWKAARDPDEENAERFLSQFVFATPYRPPKLTLTPLDAGSLTRRVSKLVKGMIPRDAIRLTVGVDIGKFIAHYVVIAWRENASSHIVDYGRFEVPSSQFGEERAIVLALRTFREELCDPGWAVEGMGETRRPDQVWIDAGWNGDSVKAFCIQAVEPELSPLQRFRPYIGFGAGQTRKGIYRRPSRTGRVIRHIGEDYHLVLLPRERWPIVEVNADVWKTFVHERLACPTDAPGAMTVFNAPSQEHIQFSKHLTAERRTQEFQPGKGTVIKWVCMRHNNHWFDACYAASAAAHLAGVRLIEDKRPAPAALEPQRGVQLKTPDGRPFVATER